MTAPTECLCTQVFQGLGWHCARLAKPHENVTYLSSPITLRDGKPLDLYVEIENGVISISDDGLTMFALSNSGIHLSDRRHWRGLETIAERHSFTLTESGVFEGRFPAADTLRAGQAILLMLSDIKAWEIEHSAAGDQDFSLDDDVEQIMARREPTWKISRAVRVSVGDQVVEFDFQWGEQFVDAIQPRPQSVNPRLRKALMMRRVQAEHQLLFIVDDRLVPKKAAEEIGLLGGVAKAIRFSDFARP